MCVPSSARAARLLWWIKPVEPETTTPSDSRSTTSLQRGGARVQTPWWLAPARDES